MNYPTQTTDRSMDSLTKRKIQQSSMEAKQNAGLVKTKQRNPRGGDPTVRNLQQKASTVDPNIPASKTEYRVTAQTW